MFNFFYTFWYGKTPLWKSYWLIGELLNAVVILLIFNIEIFFFNNVNLLKELPILNFSEFNFFSKFIFLIWTFFITVGIWKSAENYKGNIFWLILVLLILSYRLFTLRLIFFN